MGSIATRLFTNMKNHKLLWGGGAAATVLGGAYLYNKSSQSQPGQESSIPGYKPAGTNGYDQFSSSGSTIPGMGYSTTPGF